MTAATARHSQRYCRGDQARSYGPNEPAPVGQPEIPLGAQPDLIQPSHLPERPRRTERPCPSATSQRECWSESHRHQRPDATRQVSNPAQTTFGS